MKLKTTHSLTSGTDLTNTAQTITDYIAHMSQVATSNTYNDPEASINLPADTELLQEVMALVQKTVTPRLKYIIDIGIGGSNLGTKAVYDALFGYLDVISPDRFPKMIFADTVSPEFLARLTQLLFALTSKDEVIINMISKSGGTSETIGNTEVIMREFLKKFPDGHDRLIVTTDGGSKLWNAAGELKLNRLAIPKQVGGRYSVLSAVGLFPLAAAGVSISELQQGALQMRDLCITEDLSTNPALESALILYHSLKTGHTIHDTFLFSPQLESMGKWYRQLMGESIGKEQDSEGNTVHTGITPTVSIGSTDLHSVGQLYIGGPRDKITTFVQTASHDSDPAIPTDQMFPSLVEHLAGISSSTVMKAILEGVKKTYTAQKLPFMEVALDAVTAYEIGAFFQFKMMEMMYLGRLLHVNTFDQPQVELYKIETKKILAGS